MCTGLFIFQPVESMLRHGLSSRWRLSMLALTPDWYFYAISVEQLAILEVVTIT